jgi:hypothetical protein
MRRATSIALIVPSAHAWEESNALLNPEHPEFSKLTLEYVRAYRFDQRFHVNRRRSRE